MLFCMGRVDYYHDPAAPAANSLVPSVTAAVRHEPGRLLLIHKVDNDFWALPGGAMDVGESIATWQLSHDPAPKTSRRNVTGRLRPA